MMPEAISSYTYRIYTARPDLLPTVRRILWKYDIHAYTVFTGRGHWDGNDESAVMIEMVNAEAPDRPIRMAVRVAAAAAAIRSELGEQEVLVTETPCTLLRVRGKIVSDVRVENTQGES